MAETPAGIAAFLAQSHPYDTLPKSDLAVLAERVQPRRVAAGEAVYSVGQALEGLYLIATGQIDIFDDTGNALSQLGPRNSFGERGLSRDGRAITGAEAVEDTLLYVLPVEEYHRLIDAHPSVARFFDRSRSAAPRKSDLATARIADLMTPNPISVGPDATIAEVAAVMRDRHVSCVAVEAEGVLTGIVTTRDLTNRALANGVSPDRKITEVMTLNPLTLPPSALGSDVLHAMLERRIGHLPIAQGKRLVGIITQTDLTRFQATSTAQIIHDIVGAKDAAGIAAGTARLPQLLAQLVGAGNPHEVVTRLITDVADAATRRLLALAEDVLGAPPVPYLWLACGSQGRQEQTGVSDQDNCLILHDDVTPDMDGYFKALAQFVCDGLDQAGYVYCPGDMMATADRWRQPVRVWRGYFDQWIAKPDPTAQMLASVMFDLRPIGGDTSLFDDLQDDTLRKAAANSIFVAHMVSNSLKHHPPLGLLRGFATIRSGEHKNALDLKHNGVVPVVDLGRVYALQSQLTAVNTRARLEGAEDKGVISASGGHDLLDAYDLIAEMRLKHQARQIRDGSTPDNYMMPSTLSDLERSHLRDAFVVVRTMQSSVGSGRGTLG
jgi:CBS domain-containing protein